MRKASPKTGRLANGIRVVAEENASAPVFALQAWIRAGSADENEDQAGIAHLLEHMLFRRVLPPGSEIGRLAEQVESAGGDINAYTSPDCTVVHLSLPADAAEKGLQAIASIFSGPEFDPGDLEEEKKVVIEEINRSEDLPMGLLMKRLLSESFWVHPYGRPVIGSRESVGRITVQDLKSFFLDYYRPEKIIISAAGNVSMGKMLKVLDKEFKAQTLKITNHESGPPHYAMEPPQAGFRRQVIRGRWDKSYLTMAFHVGGVNDDQTAAVDLLASVLGEGTDSRLVRELAERRRWVYSISASSWTPADPGLLIIQAELDPVNVQRVIPAIVEEIESVRRGEIRPEELKRAQAQLVSGYFRGGESRAGRAGQLGFLYSFTRGINYETDYLNKINRVSVRDIRQAAEKYLRIDNLTAAVLIPEKSLTGFSEGDIDAGLAGFPQAGSDAPGARENPGAGEIVEKNEAGMKVLFPNGFRLVIRETPGSGTVAMAAAFRGGLLAEPKGKEGVSNLLAELLVRGTSRLGSLGIAEKTKLLGGELEVFSGWQSLGLKAGFLASEWREGLELLTEMIQTPTFPDLEIEKLREKITAAIRSRDENLIRLAFLRLREALYGSGQYGHDVLGSLASIPKISRDDIVAFYRMVALPDNLVVSVVGDINSREVILLAARLWGGWEPEEGQGSKVNGQRGPEKINKADKTGKTGEYRFPVPGSRQVNLVLGFPGTTLYSPDRFPLEVLDAILSGQSGRLFRNIRDRAGLAYMIGSSTVAGVEPGYFAIYLATSPERVDEAVRAVNAELADLARNAVSREELEKAKTFLVGNFEISRQTNPELAQGMALDEIYGLGYAYASSYVNNLKNVDIDSLKKSILSYLDKNLEIMIKVGASGE